ncbi:hypothetical protein Celaphus_00019009 [Cervus elaphus hippelaphus]|uniref:Uncharacterized protein n=1 Tax=Cervus elaphus hippelaphus TaxID=46360 RepID=A0A212C7J6_CEREH|nr:hypothetical protein Celaphus_00019009 [Cervus elaphus hippelaphus]
MKDLELRRIKWVGRCDLRGTIPVARIQVGPRSAGCIPASEASDPSQGCAPLGSFSELTLDSVQLCK